MRKFKYKDIKKVYSIIFFKQSPPEFHEFPNDYLHHSKQTFVTGLKLEMLQEYVMIPLDVFRQYQQNKDGSINNRLEAWLTFLSEDKLEKIVKLIQTYPDFRVIYEEMYEMCWNLEDIMRLFSKELEELDKNTVQYMIDEMQGTIDEQKKQIDEQKHQIEVLIRRLEEKEK